MRRAALKRAGGCGKKSARWRWLYVPFLCYLYGTTLINYAMQHSEVQNLREALAASPDNNYLRLILIQALIGHQAWDDAQQECLAALKREPQSVPAKVCLAQVYYGKQAYSTAIIVLEEILQEQPDHMEALLLISKAFLQEDDRARAAEMYQRVKARNPHRTDEELEQALTLKSVSSPPDSAAPLPLPDEPGAADRIAFDQVGGMEKEKEAIRIKIIHPLHHAELYQAYGKTVGGGILFYGPPGCGKTFLARATAGEINSAFMAVGINDILDMYIGQSEKKLNLLFEQARANAPCVLFFDEIDALGANRSDMRSSAGRNLINQFLSELDGISSHNEGLLVVGATNAPWHLDPAFRRPGRFDNILFVPPPDEASRQAIYEVTMANKPMQGMQYDKLAKLAKDFSGADIKASVDLAVEHKLREAMKTGTPAPLTTADLTAAIKKIKPSTKEWFQTAKNYALYANESGVYDEILEYLKIRR